MEPSQCVEELEDDVFQPEDGELGTGNVLSADLFAQSQLDCPLSRLQLFPLTHCCGPGLRPTSQEDKATQTLSPASPSQGVMLPCGVTEEPQRLFYAPAEPKSHVVAGPLFPTQSGFEWRREQEWGRSQVRLGCLLRMGHQERRLEQEGTSGRTDAVSYGVVFCCILNISFCMYI
ncbi:bcl-2-modifying factor isoform X3 [Nycticebus coucang]|uniref:bcl-2-modifying factor isoform X3 n=1 Tax=Nycticebus coucang TaxID=9470 RepID=UPI00234DD6A2|nr:bcl-2-modifying factor isoform X3 [Nycticebus coucang]